MATRPALPIAPRLPADLAPAGDLSLDDDVRWEGLSIEADLAGQVAEDPDIRECRLSACSLVGAELVRARISDSVFERCDLSAATLVRAVVTRVQFTDCRLSGADLSAARLQDVVFSECRLVDATLRMASARRARFEGCDISGADLYAAQLPGVRIFGSDLSRAELSRATLTDGMLHGSKLEDIKGAEALRGTTIGSSQVMPVAFQLLGVLGITVDDEAGFGP
jgi:uncharacterized protein YjbI with pentapeptide repeats